MFRAAWSWLVPFLGAALVFVGVLVTTPPGLGAIGAVLFGSPRGATADAAAYAIGAAASLALLALMVLAAITHTIEALAGRRAR
ncbi:MAG TPA: hypothetical protein VK898_15010 [Chloroflexota bacterium]|nr:hypothetical protein [Chloroflexota bacterium]